MRRMLTMALFLSVLGGASHAQIPRHDHGVAAELGAGFATQMIDCADCLSGPSGGLAMETGILWRRSRALGLGLRVVGARGERRSATDRESSILVVVEYSPFRRLPASMQLGAGPGMYVAHYDGDAHRSQIYTTHTMSVQVQIGYELVVTREISLVPHCEWRRHAGGVLTSSVGPLAEGLTDSAFQLGVTGRWWFVPAVR